MRWNSYCIWYISYLEIIMVTAIRRSSKDINWEMQTIDGVPMELLEDKNYQRKKLKEAIDELAKAMVERGVNLRED